jgi:hypothetical protein
MIEAFRRADRAAQSAALRARVEELEASGRAWKAQLDGDKAELLATIGNRDATIAEQAKEMYVLKEQLHMSNEDRNSLRVKLAAAGKGIEPELLETARQAMAGLLSESGRGNAAHNNQVASDAVAYARALHAALRDGAGREGA